MLSYLAKRIGMGCLTILATTIAVTLLIHLVPGDPVQIHHFDAIVFARDLGGVVTVIAVVGHDDDPVWLSGLGLDTFDGDRNVVLLVMRWDQHSNTCPHWIPSCLPDRSVSSIYF